MDNTQTTNITENSPFEPLLATSVPTSSISSKSLYSPSAFGALVSLNSLSMLCSLGSIALIICMQYKRGQKVKWSTHHVSIRLTMYASIIDICYTLFRIYDIVIAQSDTRPNSQPNCEAAMFGLTFFALLSVFIRALFSVHLHAAIIHNISRPLCYEKVFMVISFSLALLLALLPLTRIAYVWVDFDPTLGSGHCSYFSLETIPHNFKDITVTVEDAQRAVIAGILWCWVTYFGWVALTLIYCVMVIFAVIYHLWKKHRHSAFLIDQRHRLSENKYIKSSINKHRLLKASTSDDVSEPAPQRKDSAINSHNTGANKAVPMLIIVRNTEKADVWCMAKKVLRRVAQFPAIIVVCHSLEIAWATATLTRIIPIVRAGVDNIAGDLKQLYIGMQVMLALQGIFTLLSLCLEPAAKKLISQRYSTYCCVGYAKEFNANNQAAGFQQIQPVPSISTAHNMPWDVITCKPLALTTENK